MTDRRLVSAPNLVVGLSLIFLGIALVLDRLGLVQAMVLLKWWPVLAILFGAGLVAQALTVLGTTDAADVRHQPVVSPGFVLFAVVAFLVVTHVQRRHESSPSDAAADQVSVFVMMTSDEHTNRASHFRGGEVTSVMGRARLDLRQASIAPGEEVVLDVFTVMSRLELLVPEGWTVEVSAPRIIGRVRDERRPAPPDVSSATEAPDALEAIESPSPAPLSSRLVVRGLVLLGGVRIRS